MVLFALSVGIETAEDLINDLKKRSRVIYFNFTLKALYL